MADSIIPRTQNDELDDDAFAEKLFRDFDAQPAQLTKEQVDKMEANFTGPSRQRSRRAALATLALSGKELTRNVTSERDSALALAVARVSIEEYASHLREFAEMMESAGTRIGVALCSRDDMNELLAEAKTEAEDSGQEQPQRH
jgi:hypothetical protein